MFTADGSSHPTDKAGATLRDRHAAEVHIAPVLQQHLHMMNWRWTANAQQMLLWRADSNWNVHLVAGRQESAKFLSTIENVLSCLGKRLQPACLPAMMPLSVHRNVQNTASESGAKPAGCSGR